MDKARQWIEGTGHNRQEVLNRLTSSSVREGKNKRLGDHSASTGHVHNALLPEGGLQQVLAQHNTHVASTLLHDLRRYSCFHSPVRRF